MKPTFGFLQAMLLSLGLHVLAKRLFLNFTWVKWNFNISPLGKILCYTWKNPLLTPPWTKFFRRPWH